MASHPPGKCCADLGSLHEGTPSGDMIQIKSGDVNAYIAKSSSPGDKAILFLHDALGIRQNNQLLADSFAASGYTTLMPDLFNGDVFPVPQPEGFDLMGWFTKGDKGDNPHLPPQVDPIVEAGLETLKSMGFSKIAAVGYCFGAKYVVRHYKNGVQAGFVAHPSFVDDEELAAITGPLSIAAAETDSIFPAEKRHKSEEILAQTKLPYQITLYSGTSHGFAVKGDLSVKVQKFAKEKAFLQAVEWFEEHL